MKRELIIVTLIAFVIAGLSLFQTIIYIYKTPSGYSYPLVHNYEQDYYWYLSLMEQGREGNLLLTSRYSAEKFAPQLVNTFFALSGMLSGLFRFSLPAAYTFMRVVFGAGLLIAGYLLLNFLKLSKRQKFTAFILMIIGTPIWFIKEGNIVQVGEFWTGFDPILRISWLPHHLFANILLVVVLILLIKYYPDFSNKKAVLIGLIAGISGLVNPASLIIFIIIYGIFGLISFGQKISLGTYKLLVQSTFQVRRPLANVILYIPVIAVLFGLYLIQNSTFPWTAFKDWERFNQYPVDLISYTGILGTVGILALLSIPTVLKKKELGWNIIVGWFLAPFLGLGILSKILPVSNGRFLQSAGYIPAAILCSELIFILIKKISSIRGVKLFRSGSINIILVGLIVLSNLPSFWASIQRQLMYVSKNMNNPLVYITSETIDALNYLNKNSQENELVVSFPPIATLIPAFTGNRVMAGHPTFSYQAPQKEALLGRIYSGTDHASLIDALNKYGPIYIWVSPGTNTDWNNFPGITKELVYKNKSVELWRFSSIYETISRR